MFVFIILVVIVHACSNNHDSQTPAEPSNTEDDPPPAYKETWGKQFYNEATKRSDFNYNQDSSYNTSLYVISTSDTTGYHQKTTYLSQTINVHSVLFPYSNGRESQGSGRYNQGISAASFSPNNASPVHVRNSFGMSTQVGNANDTDSLPSYNEALSMLENRNSQT
ncbi:unnamed protein product [Meganyctiphanes norvegica]|uniref:Uncharacterized protein n=1 Tax=Meganyctiphanes norvegica TaxID=48144 RepID=A0AAV2QS48_MEGNR